MQAINTYKATEWYRVDPMNLAVMNFPEADKGSFLELRPQFGPAMITGLLRLEGKPFGIIANNCQHMGGTIEADDADKASRLMQLCNAHGLPLISLIDTPGFMVGKRAGGH